MVSVTIFPFSASATNTRGHRPRLQSISWRADVPADPVPGWRAFDSPSRNHFYRGIWRQEVRIPHFRTGSSENAFMGPQPGQSSVVRPPRDRYREGRDGDTPSERERLAAV